MKKAVLLLALLIVLVGCSQKEQIKEEEQILFNAILESASSSDDCNSLSSKQLIEQCVKDYNILNKDKKFVDVDVSACYQIQDRRIMANCISLIREEALREESSNEEPLTNKYELIMNEALSAFNEGKCYEIEDDLMLGECINRIREVQEGPIQ